VAFHDVFKSGSDLGYNLGLVGGLMMLTLLLYPLRKRIRVLAHLGLMEHWFRYHMFLGIGGPLLVLFHSTFKIGSMNGRIALYSMLLVALSGVIGRFVYRRVHKGLYGKTLTLSEAEKMLEESQENVDSVFLMRPDIEEKLKLFRERAFAKDGNVFVRTWRFMTMRSRANRLARRAHYEIKKTLAGAAKKYNWSRSELRLNYSLAREQVDNYIFSIVQAAQFSSWEKLFSLWHVVHIPFIYLLVLSGIAHVIAVHLY
jgi:hypothetical protein